MGKTVSDDKKVVVKSLVDSGLSYRKINEVTGVSLGLISKIVKEFEGNRELVEWYRKNKANVLAKAQLDNLALHRAVIGSISEADVAGMTVSEKARLGRDTAVNAAIFYDKEEIERSKGVDDINKALDVIMKAREVLRGQG